MIRTTFSPLSFPRIHFPPCVSMRISRRRCCWKTRTFLSLLSRSCGISRSLLPRLHGVSRVLSLDSPCEIRIAGFVRTARPWFTTILVSAESLCRVSALIMRRFRRGDAIWNNCALSYRCVFSTEKNPACFGLWQRWNTLNAHVIHNRALPKRTAADVRNRIQRWGCLFTREKYFLWYRRFADAEKFAFEFANFPLRIRTRIWDR